MSYRKQRRVGGGLGKVLRRMRRRLDLNQREFAEKLGWPPHLICKYELGDIRPSTPRLLRLLRLAENAERKPLIEALVSQGVEVIDLPLGSDLPAVSMATVCPVDERPSMSESKLSSDSAPTAGSAI